MTLAELRKLAHSRGMLGVIVERNGGGTHWIGHVILGSAATSYTDATHADRQTCMRMVAMGLRKMRRVEK